MILLKALASAYGVAVANLSRDSPEKDVRAAYRKLSLKTHPDHGGKTEDQTALNNAFDTWETACKAKASHGGSRKKQSAAEATLAE